MNNKLLLVSLFFPFFIISCEDIIEHQISKKVSFKINISGGNKISGTDLFKIKEPSDLRIICINATKYSDSTDFINDLIISVYATVELYPDLFNMPDSVAFDSVQASYYYSTLYLEKKIFGNFTKEFEISIDLSSENYKEVFVHPGLNLFAFFLMEDNVTVENGWILANIVENRNNIIEFHLKK